MFAERLKKSILQAAIQGQLTEQLPTDGDARHLLKKIRAEKSKLIAAKKIKADKILPPITDDEIPFDLPANWCWCRLGDIGKIVGGGTPKTHDNQNWYPATVSWITPADMKNVDGKYISKGFRQISEHGLRNSSAQLMPKGSVLFSSRAPIGYVAIASNELCTNQGFKSIVPFDERLTDYIYYYLTAVADKIAQMGTGTTFKEVSGNVVSKILFPLPPLAEQKRIVERVDALLIEVDELARAERELVELEKIFPRRMKNSLLQAAIQGQLTEQLPTDGDARHLLKKIRAEKSKLIAGKKIKADKILPPITDDEIPFDLPANWCWCRLGEVCNYGTNETILPAAMQVGKILIDLEDIEKDSGKLINKKFFDGKNANSSKNIFCRGQVLFGKLRVYLNKVIVADTDGYCSSEILPLDFGKNICSEYAQAVLMSPYFIGYANACSYGTKMPRLGTKAGQLALFPLPPLAEQKRIVERLNELLPLCDW